MVKLLENTFRAVNIGLVNEMALISKRLGVDVWEVIEAAATKSFGYMPFYPGPGLGGHCIPVDPQYLSWKLRSLNYSARFIDLADSINSSMPRHVLELITGALNDSGRSVNGTRILALGVTYKRDVGDLRESPALAVMEELLRLGGDVRYHDPFVPSLSLTGRELRSEPLDDEHLEASECVVILTDHSSFDYDRIVAASRLIVDTRNATRSVRKYRERIKKL